MEIKSVGGDGIYTFAVVTDGNIRRRYRVRRSTGAIEEFSGRRGRFDWRRPPFWAARSIKRAIASVDVKVQ